MDLSRFIELCSLYTIDETEIFRKLPGLSVFRRDATSDIEASVYEPVICLILQGSKVISIGDRFIELVPGDALIVSHDLPVVSRITKANASEILDPDPILDPIRKALATVETHSKRILQRWTSSHSNARLEGLNGLFQAARARARGYRNVTTFATMIYMIAAPLGDLFQST